MNKASAMLLALACLVALTATGQACRFRVMEYNVENLYDTLHDVGCDDREFLPDAPRHWDTRRYRAKLSRLARVIAAAGGEEPPALVGLCEVENDSVLRDLCRHTSLARLGFDYLITHSPDIRGIDVALLYQPLRFRPLHTESLRIPPPDPHQRPTRDVLHISGQIPTGDTLEVYIAHLPSRRGGARRTAPYRARAAEAIRRSADSVMRCRHTPLVLIMGDFNDSPEDASVAKVLGAVHPVTVDIPPHTLVALSRGLRGRDGIEGTYKYRGRWEMIDHICINGAMLRPDAPLQFRRGDCRIFTPPFLLEDDNGQGAMHPVRTFLGPVYHGGYSDHLPLVVDLWYRE